MQAAVKTGVNLDSNILQKLQEAAEKEYERNQGIIPSNKNTYTIK